MSDGKADESAAAPHEAVPIDAASLKAPRVYVGNLAFSVGWQDLKDFFRERIGEVVRVEIISYPSGRSKGCAIVEFATVEDAARAINECSNEEIQGRKIFLREDREEKGFSTRGQQFAGQYPAYPAGRGGAAMGVVGGGYPPQQQRGPSIYNQAVPGRGGGFVPRGGGRGGYGGGPPFDPAFGGPRGPPPPTGNNDGTQVYIGNLPWRTSWQELKDLGAQFGEVHRSDVAQDRFTGRSKGFGTLKFASPDQAQAAIEALNDSQHTARIHTHSTRPLSTAARHPQSEPHCVLPSRTARPRQASSRGGRSLCGWTTTRRARGTGSLLEERGRARRRARPSLHCSGRRVLRIYIAGGGVVVLSGVSSSALVGQTLTVTEVVDRRRL